MLTFFATASFRNNVDLEKNAVLNVKFFFPGTSVLAEMYIIVCLNLNVYLRHTNLPHFVPAHVYSAS